MNLRLCWNKENYQEFIIYLKSLSDLNYKAFNSKIINTKYNMLGIRIPKLRTIAREINKGDVLSFLECCNNFYYEEVLIKGLVIAYSNNFNYLESYLLEIDNWAICDSFVSSLKITNLDEFLSKVRIFLKDDYEYKVRFALVVLLNFYVEEKYLKEIFKLVNEIKREEYYINMAIAWLISECFIKYPALTRSFLENNNLNKFTQNKTISKIRDSLRVSNDVKKDILKYSYYSAIKAKNV